MNSKGIIASGLVLILISQILMAQGYEFLMSQQPIDFAHWALLIGALCMVGLWRELPNNWSKNVGLILMTVGIGGIVGMCTLDFILWAAHSQPDTKGEIFNIISSSPSINLPFLIIGPALFYSGISIATYGLFTRFKWQVIVLNVGALMIGLGHVVLNNHLIPAFGAGLLLVGILGIIRRPVSQSGE